MMAGYSIAAIPLVLIFLFTMRLFVRGLGAGAIKG
jgi:ABC-type glycerol-3-phosphate transport system permease component